MQVRRKPLLLILLSIITTAANAQITQLAELTASDGTTSTQFGGAVAMTGGTIVVGAPFAQPPAAYVFVGGGANWVQAAKLVDGSTAGDDFGGSVAISADGSTIVVGASHAGSNDQGAAYVFVEPLGGWIDIPPTAELTLTASQSYLGFSAAISADGKTIVAGANGSAVYVFTEPPGGWTNTSTPTATLSAMTAAFGLGNHVAISGDVILAGVEGFTNSYKQGAYVFVKPPTGWVNAQPTATLLVLGELPEYNYFGSVALADGATAVVSVPVLPFPRPNAPGAVYVFAEPPSGWADMKQTAKLTLPTTVRFWLGYSVAVEGNVVLAGAPYAFTTGNNAPGRIYAYVKPSTGWVSTSTPNRSLTSSDETGGEFFGGAVAFSGKFAVVGAPDLTVNGNQAQGAAYVFGPKM